MADLPEIPSAAKNRLGREFEDPHYHDEEEPVPFEEDGQAATFRPPISRKPARRMPPPKRRFYED